jgi:dihydrofolate reductase
MDYLSIVEEQRQYYNNADFVKSIDTVIVARKSFDKVISMGYNYPLIGKDLHIITRTSKPKIGSVKYYTENLKELVQNLKCKEGKNIYVDGGSEIVNELLNDNLIDGF